MSIFQSVSSVAQSYPTLCNPMDCSTPGFPVHHQLPELTQTHVHWVGDAIHPSQPLSSPSPPTFNLFQHQGLFQWVNSSYQVAKVLGFSISPLYIFYLRYHYVQLSVQPSLFSLPPWQEMQETCVPSLSREDHLEEGMATHSSIIAGKIPWTEEPGGLCVMGSQRAGHDWSDIVFRRI